MKRQVSIQKIKRAYRHKWKYVVYILPSLFLFILLGIYPHLAVFPLSMYEWSPIRESKEFVGLHYYKILFDVQQDNTLSMLGSTLLYVVGLLVIQTVVAFLMSLVLEKNNGKNKFFRAFFFMPMIFSSSMVAMIWNYMYDANLGIINNLLSLMGVDGYPGVNFFSENWRAILLIVAVHIWANLGYPLMIFTSGLSSISGDIGEAAKVDGANRWQTFRYIKLPQMLPTLFRQSLLTVVTGAKAADYIVMMGNGKAGTYDTWAASIYKGTQSGTDYGYVSAMAVVLFVFLAIVSLVQFFAMRKVETSLFGEE